MDIIYNASNISGLTLITPILYKDSRGENFESFDTKAFASLIKEDHNLQKTFKHKQFVLDTFSKSKRNVFRGLHGDHKTWKLISCLYGKIHCTVLQPDTKKIATFKLDSDKRQQILIPNDCVNGHYCMSDECLFNYKMTEHYGGIESQYTVKWRDSRYDFQWPFDLRKAIISDRDN
tara:strand:+ start:83 stop:610 length:528 start_codon:yes stop_codon:yes gene_type:complete